MAIETSFVAGHRWFQIAVVETEDLRASVTITMDGRYEWTFEEPAWRPIAVGSGSESCFLWSARELIRLPQKVDDEPQILARTDEDLIVAFEHEGGWVLVCESSVRRILGSEQTARWELPDVVVRAAWRGTELAVLDEGGEEVLLRVAGPALIQVVP